MDQLSLKGIVDSEKKYVIKSDSGEGATSGAVYRVEFNRKMYKVRICDELDRARAIEENCLRVQGLEIMPEFYGRYENSIVTEFITGKDLERNISKEDVYSLGKLIGRINRIESEPKDFDKQFSAWLDELHNGGVLDSSQKSMISTAYINLRPKKIESCLNYSDTLHHNFKRDRDGNILAIDEEAFSQGLPVGLSVVKPIDKWLVKEQAEAFLEGYKNKNKEAFEFYKQNANLIHIYFWTRFARAQLHSKRDVNIQDKIEKAKKRIFKYLTPSLT